MGLSIVKYPKAIVNGIPSTVSKWNALHHPIEFTYQRKDRSINECDYNATDGKLIVKQWLDFEGAVGDTVFVSCGLHVGIGVVDSIIMNTPTYSIYEVLWSSTVTATQYGGFVNFNSYRRNYNAITNILAVNALGAYYVLGRSINKPDYTGLIKVDTSTYLKALVDYFDTFQYNVLNWRDDSLGGRFNITYSENWTGTDGAFSAISGTALYYFVNATKQIQQAYGSNVGENVPFSNYGGSFDKAKFLSDFEVPTYFAGFPFALSFIYSENIASLPVQKKETILDVNKASLSTTTNALDSTQYLGVNRLKVSEGYTSYHKYLDVWLEANVGGVILLPWVTAGYVAAGYVGGISTPPVVTVVPTIVTGSPR